MFVLHADADAFFASVEQRDDPRLLGRPVIVAGSAVGRADGARPKDPPHRGGGGGVVLAASYEAKRYGVETAMGGRQALRLCPHAVVVRPRFDAYVDASRMMFEVFEEHSPLVEGLSIDEAFLDIRGLERIAGTPRQIATRLRAAVRERVGLPVTVGVARTKFLAKVASAAAKPDGLLVVPPDQELAFLHPLPVERVWGVGPATAKRLHAWNITTVGEIAALSEETLVAMLGRASGRQLHALAHNRDLRRVEPRRRRRSVGAQRAIGRGRHTPQEIDATLVALVDRVCRRLRGGRRIGRTVVLRLRFGDFERATRSHTLPVATASTETILAVARALLASTQREIERRGLTLVGLSVAMLENDTPRQLAFGAADALDAAVDAVRDRFGTAAITRAVLVGRDPGIAMPQLPD
jgi:DNA polymerase-4